MYHNLSIGDTIPASRARQPFSGPITPAWYIANTGRQRRDMAAAQAWLKLCGATETWYPETSTMKKVRRGFRVFSELVWSPVIPGLVFVLTDLEPMWDVIAERKRIRPMKIGDRPVAVTESVMARMADVPKRIVELQQAVAAAERAAREARTPKRGDEVEFFGAVALVEGVTSAGFLVTIGGKKVILPLDTEKRR
jgi:hypothetical protein